MSNVYFDLTREFNASEPVVALASGPAVVYYRLAMTSKDGDWIVREDQDACARVLAVLGAHGATYRPGAPLDPCWLGGGWSSHLEFLLPGRLRVRCDFFSRPPRVEPAAIAALFRAGGDPLRVVDLESLIAMKRTQRAKDYPIIGELARLLPPDREIEVTTDPDRILELWGALGEQSPRACVRAAREGRGAEQVEIELLREARRQRREDERRVKRYARVATPYLAALLAEGVDRLPLGAAHERARALAERWLPVAPPPEEDIDADAR